MIFYSIESIHDLAENGYAGTTAYDFTTGADPYAASSGNDGQVFNDVAGLALLGVLAWAIF